MLFHQKICIVIHVFTVKDATHVNQYVILLVLVATLLVSHVSHLVSLDNHVISHVTSHVTNHHANIQAVVLVSCLMMCHVQVVGLEHAINGHVVTVTAQLILHALMDTKTFLLFLT